MSSQIALLATCDSTWLPILFRSIELNLVGQVSNMIVHFMRKAPNLAH